MSERVYVCVGERGRKRCRVEREGEKRERGRERGREGEREREKGRKRERGRLQEIERKREEARGRSNLCRWPNLTKLLFKSLEKKPLGRE